MADAALAPLQELLLDEMKQPLLLVGVKGERAVLTEIIRRLGTGEIPISALSDSAASARAGPPAQLRRGASSGSISSRPSRSNE